MDDNLGLNNPLFHQTIQGIPSSFELDTAEFVPLWVVGIIRTNFFVAVKTQRDGILVVVRPAIRLSDDVSSLYPSTALLKA
jgi:hypothetical protein